MFAIYKESIEAGKISEEMIMIVASQERAREAVRTIREAQHNQLCYYKEVI